LTSGDKVHFRCGAHTFCPKEVKLGDNFRAIMTWGANMSVIKRNGTKQKLIDAGAAVKPCDFESMSADKLWTLHEKITATLAKKITAEKTRLEERLRQLEQVSNADGRSVGHARRPYPRVLPKYKNPERPSETWAGRGKQPRWLSAQLRSGKKLDDFRIQLSDQAHGRGH
jgi:DNA-binding protein H-NS